MITVNRFHKSFCFFNLIFTLTLAGNESKVHMLAMANPWAFKILVVFSMTASIAVAFT